MSTFTEYRWIGYEQCPSGETIHVLPLTITSSVPLTGLRTPGNITDAEPCPYCARSTS